MTTFLESKFPTVSCDAEQSRLFTKDSYKSIPHEPRCLKEAKDIYVRQVINIPELKPLLDCLKVFVDFRNPINAILPWNGGPCYSKIFQMKYPTL